MATSEHKFVVNQCCCCCDLRTGTIVIAILDMIGSFINAGYKAYYAIHYNVPSLWFDVVIYLALATVAILLLSGVRKGNAKFVWVWVWVSLVLTILFLIGGIVVVVKTGAVGFIVGTLIGVALMLYFIIVVRSYAFELQSGGDGSGNKV